MTYLVVLILILFGVFNFDFSKKNHMNYSLYDIIVIYLIIISAIAYRMGDDGITYEEQFDYYKPFLETNISYYINHQYFPGWVFLNVICKSFESFVLFKLIFALFVNSTITKFVKKYAVYPYLCLLFYFVFIFFDFNFTILRQAFAVAIFIGSLNYFGRGGWTRYYLCCCCALLFHHSALLLFFLPLVKHLTLKGKGELYFGVVLGGLLFFSFTLSEIFVTTSFANIPILEYFGSYQSSLNEEDSVSLGIPNILLNVVMPVVLLKKLSGKQTYAYMEPFVMCYIVFYVLSSFLPIFYRFLNYFLPFYIIFLVDSIVYCFKLIRLTSFSRAILCVLVSLSFLTFKKRLWFENVEGTHIPKGAIIYPYSSVIFEEKIPERESLYKLIDDDKSL